MLRNKTVLFADNNRTFLMLVGVLMKRLGLGFINASTADEAMRLIKEQRPDLAVLEKDLGGNGIDTLRKLKSNGNRSDLPIIVISDDNSREARESCLSLGCLSYLTKPLVMRELHDAIQEALFTSHGTNRKNLRVDSHQRVEVVYDNTVTNLFTETISEGGVYLKSDSPIPVGKDVMVKFHVEGWGPLELRGCVIYNKRLAGDNLDIPPGSAVKFASLSEAESDALKGMVSRLIAGDIMAAQNGELISE